MDLPAFAAARGDQAWSRKDRTLATAIDGVSFTAQSPRLSTSWIVTGVSKLALPVDVLVYISRAGAAHGYWRNVEPRLVQYFSHCDVPALMPVLVGRQTWRAIREHDDPQGEGPDRVQRDGTVELHIRGGEIETTTKVDHDNDRVIADQLAIHQALAADQLGVLDAWQAAAEALHGSVATSWPPVLTVPRGFGSTTISLHWPPSTHASARASIELSADARGAKLWSLEREPQPTPNTRELVAGRHFLIMGDIPIAIDQLTRAIARADIVSIHVRRHVTITIAHHAPDPQILDAMLELLGALCSAPSEPYR